MCSVVFFSISDQLSYRWFTRSKVLVVSVNLMAKVIDYVVGGAGLVFQWLRSGIDSE